ncbi:MAG: tRNA-dihydrouridine synthase family protein [Treponema sp.]|nr:tRNA-dihydrouridine synthase family protein [Treponema sp.]
MRLICGPMATISHPAFRILLEQFGGCDEYFTEMINAGTLLTGGQFEKYYIDPAPVPGKIVWQLTGHDVQNMKEAAARLAELPGIGIDINMGCSAPDIYKYGAGISWMIKDREETIAMVKAVRSVVPAGKRLSVKLRLGDDNFTDKGFFDFCDMLVGEGVELLTLHPRTKKEKLVRPPRYSYCQQLAERYKGCVPVYLNGNVKDKASYDHAVASCPDVAGVMISRAAVQRPWIFRELVGGVALREPQGPQLDTQGAQTATGLPEALEGPLKVDMLNLAQTYIKNIQLYQPPEFWKTRLQRFFTYYSQNFKFAHYAQTQFINARDIPDLEQRLEDFFQKCPEERLKSIL